LTAEEAALLPNSKEIRRSRSRHDDDDDTLYNLAS